MTVLDKVLIVLAVPAVGAVYFGLWLWLYLNVPRLSRRK